mmetsp:Transcript_27728/g.58590  ORF Transcript_27728/g.58590 Transcript_27728/m.58590 type:complete len:288 (-) Transcript_27728:236-1099(-)
MATAHNMNNNIPIASSAMDAHFNNFRNSLPPSLRNIPLCCPENTSTLLRNIIVSSGILHGFLLLSSLFVAGSRFMGFSIFTIAIISSLHFVCTTLVFGDHVLDALAGILSNSSAGMRMANTLRNTSTRYGTDMYMHGTLFGSACILAILMHVLHSYYGGLAECVTNAASSRMNNNGANNLTGGYANMHENDPNTYNMNGGYVDPYTLCGSSGPVGFVSFITGLLFWIDMVLAVTLYTRRHELLNGGGGGGVSSSQYDEIGVQSGSGGVGGFDGDFPSSSEGMQTMNV